MADAAGGAGVRGRQPWHDPELAGGGLLSTTDRTARTLLFWRDDVRRVLAAPRYNHVGVHYETLRTKLGR